ncbi:hypothetical protein [uncultured Pontibacter sp.]|uniref:hypothetical protein n=1 Tax=uncultured Pontibacter sp. TaxID=453356 RepID=UPI002637415D|nr:hypothetical protein [uncultured Pontibacter sp.]
MRRRYAFLMAGALFTATAITACSSDNTTGVETDTTENKVNGMQNEGMEGMDSMEGDTATENISPTDTSTVQRSNTPPTM